jgi:structure-specific recognition protein 1
MEAYKAKLLADGEENNVMTIDNNEMKSPEETIKKVKKVKDKNAPRGSLTAYNFFCNEQRQVIKDEHPDFSFSDISIECGARWKALSEEKKIPFQKLADGDKIRYKTEMNAYKTILLADGEDKDNNEDNEDNIDNNVEENQTHVGKYIIYKNC